MRRVEKIGGGRVSVSLNTRVDGLANERKSTKKAGGLDILDN